MPGGTSNVVFSAGLTVEQASVVRAGALAGHTRAALLRRLDAPPADALAVVLPAVVVADVLNRWGGPGASPPVLAVAATDAEGTAALEAGASMILLEPISEERVRLRLGEVAARRIGHSLATILDTMADGFAAADAAGRITAVNDAFCRLTGFGRHELVGAEPPYPFWAPEAVPHITEALAEALAGGRGSVRLRFRHRDGSRLTVTGSVSVLTGPDGRPAGAVGTFRDDTLRSAAEAELRESAAELRSLVDHLPAAAVLRDPDGSLRLNARARALIGWSSDHLANVDDWFRLLYPGRSENVRARYEEARANGFPSSAVGRAVTASGASRVLEFFAYLAADGGEVWLATDITARVEAQRDRDRRGAELQALMAALPDLVIRLAGDGTVLQAHGASELVAAGAQAGTPNVRDLLPGAAGLDVVRAIGEVVATGETREIECGLEVPAGHRWFCARIAAAGPDQVVAVVRDDTERHDAARDRERLFRYSAEPMAIFSMGGRALEINPAMERLLGFTAEELDAMGVEGFVHPEDQPAVREAIAGIAAGRPSEALPQRLRRKGGRWVWAEVTASPDADRGLVYLSVHDITERRRVEMEQQALTRVAELVASEVAPENLFTVVAEEVGRLFDADGAGVAEFDGDLMRLVARWGDDLVLAAESSVLSPIHGEHRATAEVARTGRPARDDRIGDDGRVVRSSVAAPVRVGGRLWGAVGAVNTTREPFPPGAEEHMARFGDLVALAISNAQMHARLVAEATTDPLTGLANHRTFRERLEGEMLRANRHGRPLALALIDLDHFKRVNDRHGHQVGDAVLAEAARRLQERCRSSDVIARVGGEEFAWLMPETDGLAAWQAAERAREAVAAVPFATVGRVTASIGVCDLAHAATADDLYRLADGALYWAKHHGRDVAFMYSPDVVEVLSDADQADRLLRHQALQSIRVLARAVDAKDPSTRQHSERVADLAVALATALDWPVEQAALLREAGLVHDVGKIAVPDSILFKPGRLTDEEFERVKAHAAAGAEMVADVLSADQVAWVRGHHERWDGGGYPDGLAGESIPEGARILALADSWDVMTAERPYNLPLPRERALAECRACAGGQFWEPAVAALERLHESGALEVVSGETA